jgi:curved DNA-binding protein CbpA
MMKKIEDLNYYELLEVSPTATSQEIHKAYERTRKVYDPNSIALYSLFTPEETAAIQQRIEDAYRTLMYDSYRKKYDEMLRSQNQEAESDIHDLPYPGEPSSTLPLGFDAPRQPQPQAAAQAAAAKEPPKPEEPELLSPQPFDGEFTGSAIRLLREKRNMTVKHVAEVTKVGARYLELIEEENYAKLPVRPYLRGFLVLYAKALGYEPERLTSDYLKRYDAAMNTPKK